MRFLKNTAVALALAFAIASLSSPARASHCSLAASAGDYGFTLNGILVLPSGPVPIAGVGRATVNPDGTVSGTEARNVGGEFANETFNGTFAINPDCTGTLTLNFFEAGQLVRVSVLSTVMDDNNQEFRMVQQSLTLPNGASVPAILTGEVRRITTVEND